MTSYNQVKLIGKIVTDDGKLVAGHGSGVTGKVNDKMMTTKAISKFVANTIKTWK